MGTGAVPPAEVEVGEHTVRGLLLEQHADLATLPIRHHDEGWDNVLFRLGDELLVRLPRRAAAAELIVHELTWLPRLAPGLPLPVPAPVRVGRPDDRFPWCWTVVPWFDGEPVGTDPLLDPTGAATDMGSFLAALHHPARPDAPHNAVRGGPLADRLPSFDERLTRLPGNVDVDRVRTAFLGAVHAPVWSGPPVWLHGDLHPHNLLQHDGKIVAVIDFGDITAGDPATDLMVAWSLFDEDQRSGFRRAADSKVRPIDDATWERGRGWAISHSVAMIASGADSSWQTAVGLRTLAAAVG